MKNSKSKSILVLNGPNLNLLGSREPEIYGRETLLMIERRLVAAGKAKGIKVECFQTNHEGVIVDRVQQAKRDGVEFILLNPAAFTYSSIALRDALTAVQIPFIEVHLSNIHAREPWRAHSHFTAVAVGSVLGLGSRGYDLALDYAMARLKTG
ncbi:MAG: type II 3-dehydroquinate dehydratase [Betaproteobacteria bacterium]|nr:type II 3-dehydroquinate dehydratase [Betaproteobacteria bacterium]MSQ88107.1 type II 3-dehydroquinate dehydratase [Betaproteobacteria bacterium]